MAQICSNTSDHTKQLLQRFPSVDKEFWIKEYCITVIRDYIQAATRHDGSCDLCRRYTFNLTKHHLVPRAVHKMVRKEGWQNEHKLSQIGWLCWACRGFAHKKYHGSCWRRIMWALTDFEREVTSKTGRKMLEKLLRGFDEQPFSRRSLEP